MLRPFQLSFLVSYVLVWIAYDRRLATAAGAPILAATANPVPTGAKSEVMVRDFVGRVACLFSYCWNSKLAFRPVV
jgi:hypothetical protein